MRGARVAALCVVVVASLLAAVEGFYLPGIHPISRAAGDDVPIFANSLHSNRGVAPYGYYFLPFCRPTKIRMAPESLGEILSGDRVESSPYTLKMKQDVKCALVPCTADDAKVTMPEIKLLEKFIEDDYRGYLVMDNLPVFNNGSSVYYGRCKDRAEQTKYPFLRGYALGVSKRCEGAKTLVNNHIQFRVQYHQPFDDEPLYRVVGFTAVPHSVKHSANGDTCSDNFVAGPMNDPLTVKDVEESGKITWSYSVEWVEEAGITWASRWDSYLHTSVADTNESIHWTSIINSLLIVICLSTIATIILLRALHVDFNRYNSEDVDEAQEEVGWKLVHNDVFRPPQRTALFTIVIANGMQVCGMVVCTLFFAVLGFLSPAHRGAMLTTLILFFVLQSLFGGYVCSRMLLLLAEKNWRTVFFSAITLPGAILCVFLSVEILATASGAANAVPFVTLISLFSLWICVSIPLAILGAAFGYRQTHPTHPLRVGKLAREIPVQRWYLESPAIYLLPPLIPFGASVIELKFILGSLWQGMVYYVFGFFAVVFFVWVITASLTTLIVIYYQLCFENHRWWWRSFFIPGGTGIHFFLYCVYYYFTELQLSSLLAKVMYFGYMGLLSMAYGLTVGCVGFFSAWMFVRKIYTSIKID